MIPTILSRWLRLSCSQRVTPFFRRFHPIQMHGRRSRRHLAASPTLFAGDGTWSLYSSRWAFVSTFSSTKPADRRIRSIEAPDRIGIKPALARSDFRGTAFLMSGSDVTAPGPCPGQGSLRANGSTRRASTGPWSSAAAGTCRKVVMKAVRRAGRWRESQPRRRFDGGR